MSLPEIPRLTYETNEPIVSSISIALNMLVEGDDTLNSRPLSTIVRL
jgi:hypothetical protein